MNPRFLSYLAVFLIVVAACIVFFKNKENADSPAETIVTNTPNSSTDNKRARDSKTTSRNEKMTAEMKVAEMGHNHMISLWLKSASGTFAKTSEQLVTDVGLSTGQAAEVEALFAGRKEKLAGMLASLTSDRAEDPHETMRQITALLRYKGLREDLAGIVSGAQLAAYDAAETKRQRETIEAMTYRDMAAINAVLTLTDSQKQQLLGALSDRAAKKVEQEADARAFMTLAYGNMASEIDVSNVEGLAGMLNPDLAGGSIYTHGSVDYFRWMEKQREERIEMELSPLRNVLDENQLTRYREHLEEVLPR